MARQLPQILLLSAALLGTTLLVLPASETPAPGGARSRLSGPKASEQSQAMADRAAPDDGEPGSAPGCSVRTAN